MERNDSKNHEGGMGVFLVKVNQITSLSCSGSSKGFFSRSEGNSTPHPAWKGPRDLGLGDCLASFSLALCSTSVYSGHTGHSHCWALPLAISSTWTLFL